MRKFGVHLRFDITILYFCQLHLDGLAESKVYLFQSKALGLSDISKSYSITQHHSAKRTTTYLWKKEENKEKEETIAGNKDNIELPTNLFQCYWRGLAEREGDRISHKEGHCHPIDAVFCRQHLNSIRVR